jgi:hypothetical protein
VKTVLRIGYVALLFASCGCSKDCCDEQHESYRVSGAPPDGAAQCPALVFSFYESKSTRCSDNCTSSASNPGTLVLEKPFAPSAKWSTDVPVTYLNDERPSLDVYAYCDQNQNGRIDEGESCLASTFLAPGNHDSVELDDPTCPHRL